jgi:hypothetical protein
MQIVMKRNPIGLNNIKNYITQAKRDNAKYPNHTPDQIDAIQLSPCGRKKSYRVYCFHGSSIILINNHEALYKRFWGQTNRKQRLFCQRPKNDVNKKGVVERHSFFISSQIFLLFDEFRNLSCGFIRYHFQMINTRSEF